MPLCSFLVIGQKALASPDFRLDDLPSTGGRLDALVRCLRAALLVSHGVRRDVVVYLILRGGPDAPRVLRVHGERAEYLRPDERSLAVLVQKALASASPDAVGFGPEKRGVSVARGDLELALADVAEARLFVLEETGEDARGAPLDDAPLAFVLGDPLGFDGPTREALARAGARPVSVGPVSLHTEDVITVITNELDRRVPRSPRS